MATRLEVDGLATGSSASTKSRSLERLLVLHTLLGAAVLQRTTGGSSSGRARSALRDATAGWTGAPTQLTAVRPSRWWSQQP